MGYKSPRTYTICHSGSTSANPLDATVYYIGGTVTGLGTANASRQTSVAKRGIIRSVMLQIYSGTVIGTNEDWTWSLYDGTTTTAIATLGAATAMRTWSNTNLNYPIAEGGYFQLTTTTPAWVTNPEGCTFFATIIIEYE